MNLTWVDFYSEFATKLLAYKNKRTMLIKKFQNAFDSIPMKIPKMESEGIMTDIDPFSIFGTFNKSIRLVSRIAIAKMLGKEFGIQAAVPEGFAGVPVVNNLSACFFSLSEARGTNDIQNLWNVFEAAIDLAKKDSLDARKTFIHYYDLVKYQKGIRWNITMGLYWIRPFTFVNLDGTNREFINNTDNMPADFVASLPSFSRVVTGSEYLEICRACNEALKTGAYSYKTFPEMSHDAWLLSESRNNHENKTADTDASFQRWLRPLVQALLDHDGFATPSQLCDTIAKTEALTHEETGSRERTDKSQFRLEVASARHCLARAGYIAKHKRPFWTLTDAGKIVDLTDELIKNIYREYGQIKTPSNEAMPDQDVTETRYWLYVPGSGVSLWDEFYSKGIMAIGWDKLGDLNDFDSKDEIKKKMKDMYDSSRSYNHAAHTTWQFVNEIQEGDVIFVKRGKDQIVGRGVVTSGYVYDPGQDGEYCNIRQVKWLDKGIWHITEQADTKTLINITPYTDEVEKLNALFTDADDGDLPAVQYPPYSIDDFLEEVYLPKEIYHDITQTIRIKKNIILQGAPGVGKTFIAKRLAYSMMGVRDKERVMMVQFHQSYSYEDFIMGFRPTTEGFELKKGTFYNFCKKAEIDSNNDYFFIIDEINRGNLSKIFGELFMLIESDKRDVEVQLLYSEKFSVPENVYIIGMMNTADRSLALLDYALRRRFAFIDLKPGFDTEGFQKYCREIDNKKFDQLINCVKRLNDVIASDEALGENFMIGHSFFCNLATENTDGIDESRLKSIVEFELIPLLKEYWFDEYEKVRDWSRRLRDAIK